MNNTEKLHNAFAEALNIDASIINDELKYRSIPQWDSISHMVLISTLEEKFNVSISTDDVIDLSSVGKAKEILKKYNITF
jgi:acyl carrier protein